MNLFPVVRGERFNTMDSKSATKSRIPTATFKKEQKSDSTKERLDNKEPSKILGTKNNAVKPKATKSELNGKTKTTSDTQIAKRNVEKTTCLGKAASTLGNLKPKTQIKNVSPKEIGTLSKETSSKFVGTGVKRNSKLTGGPSSSRITNAREEAKIRKDPPAPKSAAEPKKSTITDHLERISKLTRSRTEYGPNFGKAGSSSVTPPLKSVLHEKARKSNQVKEVSKNSVLKGKETCTPQEKDALPKETSADSGTPLARSGSVRVPRRLPLERKPISIKPLKRSNTIHVFDSVPVRKLSPIVVTNNDTFDLEADTVPFASTENHISSLLGENGAPESYLTPKKDVPHSGIPFKIHRAKSKSGVFKGQSEK